MRAFPSPRTHPFSRSATAQPSKVPVPGTQVHLQLWYRDPQNTSNQTTSLSDAVEFVLAP